MKTIVAGSREITSQLIVANAMKACPWLITEVISGTARGVDQLGESVANSLGLTISRFPADWNTYMTNALDDLIRAFCLFEGKAEPDHRTGMYSKLNNIAFYDGEYFTIKIYKKGSGHLVFKKPELVERLNLILAKHYPDCLPRPKTE
jgi:hypothetical protein